MFSSLSLKSFSTSLSSIVSSIASPSEKTRLEAFQDHIEHIRNFYRHDEKSVGKARHISTTNIAYHLDSLNHYLKLEAQDGDDFPCMEYLSQNGLLDLLVEKAQAEVRNAY